MEKAKIIVARPGEKAYVTELRPEYDYLKKLIGGPLEITYPFSDEVAVICDECGKLKGKMPNRLLHGKHSRVTADCDVEDDTYAGTILILGSDLDSEDFTSLTDAQIDLYMDIYGEPQFKTDWGLGGDEDE